MAATRAAPNLSPPRSAALKRSPFADDLLAIRIVFARTSPTRIFAFYTTRSFASIVSRMTLARTRAENTRRLDALKRRRALDQTESARVLVA